ncbi:MAG: hypothetical protein B7Z15_03410 [Rhizobiales bacterium 32-66-8]|nr:MAG: hypothetical protein B7Z15_03410 [Rhizobiales bacterium 32-66-8]
MPVILAHKTLMLCAECPRCRRRSIVGLGKQHLTDEPPLPETDTAKLRCDICGSKDVKLHRFVSSIEALRFTNSRMR